MLSGSIQLDSARDSGVSSRTESLPLSAAYWFSLCPDCGREPELCTHVALKTATVRCPGCGFSIPSRRDPYLALSDWYARCSAVKALKDQMTRAIVR